MTALFTNTTTETLLVTMNSEKLEAVAFAWQGELMLCFPERTNRFRSSNPVRIKIYQSNLMNYEMKWPEYLNGSFNIQDLNWSLASNEDWTGRKTSTERLHKNQTGKFLGPHHEFYHQIERGMKGPWETWNAAERDKGGSLRHFPRAHRWV